MNRLAHSAPALNQVSVTPVVRELAVAVFRAFLGLLKYLGFSRSANCLRDHCLAFAWLISLVLPELFVVPSAQSSVSRKGAACQSAT